jgi:hypothetical protein
MFPQLTAIRTREEGAQNIFLGASRESEIAQGSPKESRGALSCAREQTEGSLIYKENFAVRRRRLKE